MNLDCPRCGGLLEVRADEYLLECPYCGAAVPIDGEVPSESSAGTPPPEPPRPEPPPPKPPPAKNEDRVVRMVPWAMALALLLVFGSSGLVFFLVSPLEGDSPPEAAVLTAPAEPAPSYDDPPGPVVSRPEAKKLLRPKLLACMKEHEVYYLITRIGQGYDAPRGLYPPLTIVHGSTVDYRDVDDLIDQPLGQCILEAAGELWFAGNRGAYLSFGLRNPDAPDPLAGQPKRIDQKTARRALRALDAAAQDCGRRKLEGFRPGRDLSILVTFRGLEGVVVDVDPFYVNRGSPYGQCLEQAYGSATVPRFRNLRAKVLHKLPFLSVPGPD